MWEREDELASFCEGGMNLRHRIFHLIDGHVVVDEDCGDQVVPVTRIGAQIGGTADRVVDSQGGFLFPIPRLDDHARADIEPGDAIGPSSGQLSSEVSLSAPDVENALALQRKAPLQEMRSGSPVGKKGRFIAAPLVGTVIEDLFGTVTGQVSSPY